MKLMKIFIGLLFINFTILASNTEENQCAGNIPQSSIQAQIGGLYKPSSNGVNEYMKVLVVFVQFDSTDVNVNNTTWPKDQMPTWANSLISSSPSSSYPDMTISDYWKEMSIGSFDFIGDVYPSLVTINTEDYYKNNGYHFGECNKDALTQINPYVDFSDYDNWSFNNSTQSFEFTPDGYVDMIIMIYRTPKNERYDPNNPNSPRWFDDGEGDFNAIAVLSGGSNTYTLNFDGVNILAKRSLEYLGSGLTIKKGIKSLAYTLPILAHEYGHYLFGGNHGNTGGIMSGSYSLSAVERERLGHIAYTNCTQNNFTLTLEDFITSGDVLRIPIPITNSNSTTFFLVENHQKLSKYDQIIRGGSIGGGYDYTDTGSGIYVWLVKSGNASISNVDYEAVTADGRWDWAYDGDYYAGPGWYVGKPWEGYLPKTKRISVNRNTGKTDKKEEHIYWNNHNASKWVDNRNGSYELTRNVMGDEFDAFNFDYNEILTPWSNPSSYISGVGNTNISIQLYNKSGNNITVKVFTTYNSSLNLAPSVPQNLKSLWYNNHPKITWEANIEPDFNHYEIYKKKNSSTYNFFANTTNTNYVDYTETKYSPRSGNKIYISYKVKAVDNSNKKSLLTPSSISFAVNGGIEKTAFNENDTNVDLSVYKLYPNYPNPFNPTTQINYQIPKDGYVNLTIYNMLGQKVFTLVNEQQTVGIYSVEFNASNLPSGVYVYKLQAGEFNATKKMLLTK